MPRSPQQFEGGARTRFATLSRRARIEPPARSEPMDVPGAPHEESAWNGSLLSVDQIMECIETFREVVPYAKTTNKGLSSRRRIAVLRVLEWLSTFPGASWNDRWNASRVEDDPEWTSTISDAVNGMNGTRYPSNYMPSSAVRSLSPSNPLRCSRLCIPRWPRCSTEGDRRAATAPTGVAKLFLGPKRAQ
jgi:hypothetical protein